MKPHKCFRQALNMVIHSRLRSWLTIIGIVIGIASVVAIISMTDSLEASMDEQMGDIGADLITITPGVTKGGGFGPGRESPTTSNEEDLTKKDVQILKVIPEVEVILTQVSGKAEVYFMGDTGDLTITGVDQKEWAKINTDELDSGRKLDSADKNVVVIGYSLATEYFENEVGINKQIIIEGKSFRVVGVLEDGTRNSIYMPIDSAYEVIEDSEKDIYDSIQLKIGNEELVEETLETIEYKLRLSRHVTEKDQDFTVSSNQQSIEMRAEMMGTMTLFLTVIAGISLLVGAIGIANTMFTSVLEKTKEIGIMKAIGAKNRDILNIFLFNAGIIGLIGGSIGLLLGVFVSNLIAAAMGVDVVIAVGMVLMALGVSVGAGIIAGYIPAVQASKLKPVDALRYE